MNTAPGTTTDTLTTEPPWPPPEVTAVEELEGFSCRRNGREQSAAECSRWVVAAGRAGPFGQPTITRTTVWAGTTAGLVALDTDTGVVRWTAATAAAVRTPVAVRGNRVVAVDDDNILYSFARTNGELDWQVQLPGSRVGGPVIAADTIAVPLNGKIVLVHVSGTHQWTVRTSRPSPLATVRTDILFGTTTGTVQAQTVGTQIRTRWRTDTDAFSVSAVPGRDLVIASPQGRGRVVGLDPDDGQVRWRSDRPVPGRAHPAPNGRVAYVTDPDTDRLLVVDLDDGSTTTVNDSWPDTLGAVGPQGWLYRVRPQTTVVAHPVTGGRDPATRELPLTVQVPSGRTFSPAVGHTGQAGLMVLGTPDGRLIAIRPPARHPRLDNLQQLAPGQSCPASPVISRPYGTVLAGPNIEIHRPPVTPDNRPAGAVTRILTMTDVDQPIRLSGRRLDQPGTMTFRRNADSRPTDQLTLRPSSLQLSARTPSGWTVIDQPEDPNGCWAYRIDGNGFSDVLVFAADPGQTTATPR